MLVKNIWEYSESEGIGSAPAVGDIDGDGKSEIIITTEDTPLICLSNDGTVKWRYTPKGDVLASGRKREVTAPIIRDINGDADGDGKIEIYANDLSGNIVCITFDGKQKWTAKLEAKARRSASIADLLGDGSLCAVIPQISGSLIVYRWSSVNENRKILWPEYRGWASRTAGEYLETKRKISADIVTGTSPSYQVEEKDFINNLSELKKTRDELTKLIPQLRDNKGLLERVYYLSGQIEESQKLIDNIKALSSIKTRELRDNLVEWNEELSRLLVVANDAVEKDKIIVAYAANPWAPFGGVDEIIEGRTPDSKITIEAFQGEFESAALITVVVQEPSE